MTKECDYMNVRKARKLRDILMITGIIIILCGSIYQPLWIVGSIVAFSGLVPHFLYNKCPHCRRQLGRSNGLHCQYCGKALDWLNHQFSERLLSVNTPLSVILTKGGYLFPKSVQKVKGRYWPKGGKVYFNLASFICYELCPFEGQSYPLDFVLPELHAPREQSQNPLKTRFRINIHPSFRLDSVETRNEIRSKIMPNILKIIFNARFISCSCFNSYTYPNILR